MVVLYLHQLYLHQKQLNLGRKILRLAKETISSLISMWFCRLIWNNIIIFSSTEVIIFDLSTLATLQIVLIVIH